MATVYLHIGFPKTGTTALQNFLTDNDALLKSHGICYPDVGLRYQRVSWRRNARFLIAPYKEAGGELDRQRPCAEYEPTLDQIAQLGNSFDKILLTDEALWNDSRRRPDFWPKLRSDLDKRGLGLRVIVYLRAQDSFIQSLYRQKVKSAATILPFREYLETLGEDGYFLDFASYLDVIADAAGPENLIVRVYENSQFRGPERTIFSDFLDIFGLTLSDGFKVRKSIYNISLDGFWLELRRLFNSLPAEEKHDDILRESMNDIQYRNPLMKNTPKYTLFCPEEHAAFVRQFEESNRRTAAQYLGREDGTLFYDSSASLPEYRVDTEDLLRGTILVYGRAIELLEQRLEQQTQTFEKQMRTLEKQTHTLEKQTRALEKQLRTQQQISEDSTQLASRLRKAEKKNAALDKSVKKLEEKNRQLWAQLREVRESVLWYRLKRKVRHLLGIDKK